MLTLAIGAAPASAAPVYPIYEISDWDLDVHDGTLADWEALVPGPSLAPGDFASVPSECGECAVADPADLGYRIYLGWHHCTQTVWIGVERADDAFSPYGGGDTSGGWQGDIVEFMVDVDHSGGSYSGFTAEDFASQGWEWSDEMVRLVTGYQAQRFTLALEPPAGVHLGVEAAASGWCAMPPWADAGGAAWGTAPTTSIAEAYVTPWDALDWHGPEYSTPSTMSEGRIIGFQVAIPDWDAAGTLHGFHTVGGQANTWRTADSFVDGELICAQGDCWAYRRWCSGCAVLPHSWGRIKEALR